MPDFDPINPHFEMEYSMVSWVRNPTDLRAVIRNPLPPMEEDYQPSIEWDAIMLPKNTRPSIVLQKEEPVVEVAPEKSRHEREVNVLRSTCPYSLVRLKRLVVNQENSRVQIPLGALRRNRTGGC